MTTNEPFDVKCSVCGAVLMGKMNTDERHFARSPFITGVIGIHKDLGPVQLPGNATTGEIVNIRETPHICASVECLQKLLDDPSWKKSSAEELTAKMRELAEHARARGYAPLDEASLQEIDRAQDELEARLMVLRAEAYHLPAVVQDYLDAYDNHQRKLRGR